MMVEHVPRDVFRLLRDPGRLSALRRTRLLDSPAEPAFDRLSHLAARLVHAPVALVVLVDQDRQFFKSCLGLPEPWASQRETPLSHSFCLHEIASGQPLIIDDARTHPLVCENLAIRDLGVVAYAGIPLITADGHAIGSFCVIDSQPRHWMADDVAILRELAAATMTEIGLRVATAEAHQRAEEAERERAELRRLAARLQARHDALRSAAVFRGPPAAPAAASASGRPDTTTAAAGDARRLRRAVWAVQRG